MGSTAPKGEKTGMGHGIPEDLPTDQFPEHIKKFMEENGGEATWSKQRELTPEEAKKYMEEQVGAAQAQQQKDTEL